MTGTTRSSTRKLKTERLGFDLLAVWVCLFQLFIISFFAVVTVVVWFYLPLDVNVPRVLIWFLGSPDPVVLLDACTLLYWSCHWWVLLWRLVSFVNLSAIFLQWFMDVFHPSIFSICPFLSLLSHFFWSVLFATGVFFLSNTVSVLGGKQSDTYSFWFFLAFLTRNLFVQGLPVLFNWEFHVIINWNSNCSIVFYFFLKIVKVF